MERGQSGELMRGLVVDWGGVLTPSLDLAMRAWVDADGVTYDHFQSVLREWAGQEPSVPPGQEPVADLEVADDDGPAGTSPVHRLERGELPTAEFERVLASELARRGSPVQAEGLLGRMLGGLSELEDDMIGLVRRARAAGVRTALLSNSWGNAYPAQLWDGTFDVLVISGEVGMRKPEPEIFRYTCAKLGLPPGSCVMVDDLRQNVAGAVSVGMTGVLHTGYGTTADELEVLLGLPLR